MTTINFAGSRPFTIGVELEFQLIDQDNYNLVPLAPAIIDSVPKQYASRVVPEFLQSILEIRTGVCTSISDVEQDLGQSIRAVRNIAEKAGCLLFSSSLHPFACPEDQVLSFGERYWRIMKELQYVGRQFICQGLHIHIGVKDKETAIKACDTLQAYLPILLSMSCSSPFFRGDDTGFQSYRTKLFEALPLAGITGFHGSWKGLEQEVDMLRTHHIISEFRDLWWDVRPSPNFGTIEIRACDLPLQFNQVLGLTALAQALTAGLAAGLARHESVSHQVLSCNKWQAARHGLKGSFVDPLGLLGSSSMMMADAAKKMIELLSPFLKEFGGDSYISHLEKMIEKKMTGADKQRVLVAGRLDFHAMMKNIYEQYWL